MIKNVLKKYSGIPLPVRASMWFVVCGFVQKGISFITTPIFTRLMSTENYGMLTVYSSWLEIISIFATLQLTTGVFNKAMMKYEEDRDGYTSSMLVLTSLITVGVAGICYLFRDIFGMIIALPGKYMVALFLEILSSTVLGFWSIRNRFEFRYRNVVGFSMFVCILGPACSVALILAVDDARQSIAKICGILLVKIVVGVFLGVKILLRGRKLFSVSYWIYSVKYNLPLIPHYLSQQVLSQADRIMISHYEGMAAAAVYGVAYQLSRVVFTFVLAIHQTFTPWAFENIKKENYGDIRKNTLILEMGIGALCVFASLFAPELIYIVGGEQYMAAVWIVPPVSISVLFQSIYTFFADLEFYFERTSMIMTASVVVGIVNVLLNAMFIPIYGFTAAGYTTMVCYILYSFVHYLFMKTICRQKGIVIPYNGRAMWTVGLAYAAISVFVGTLYQHTVWRYLLIVSILCGTAAFVFVYRKKIKVWLKLWK